METEKNKEGLKRPVMADRWKEQLGFISGTVILWALVLMRLLPIAAGMQFPNGLESVDTRGYANIQRRTVHKLRNLLAKAPKHRHEAVREGYHRMVYAETLAAAEKTREGFLLKWKKTCPGVAASLQEAGENLLTFYRFPESQWLSLRPTNAIERMQLEFRRRVKTQAALPNEGAVLRVFFGLWISGRMKLHRINGYRDIGGKQKAAP